MATFYRMVGMDDYQASICVEFEEEFEVDVGEYYGQATDSDKAALVEMLNNDEGFGYNVHNTETVNDDSMPPEQIISAFNDMSDQEFLGMPDEYLEALRARLAGIPVTPTCRSSTNNNHTILKQIIHGLTPNTQLNSALLNEMKQLA